MNLGCLSISQGGCQLVLEEIEERILMRPDLDKDDVIVASLDEATDRLEMMLR